MNRHLPSPAEVVAHCDTLLQAARFRDYTPNGLQVEGVRSVRRLVTGVSANLTLIEAAITLQADLILVHHGLFWGGDPRPLTGVLGRRVRALMQSGTALAAYHLPLDAHPTLGNNAALADLLQLNERTPFGRVGDLFLGVGGLLPIALGPQALGEALGERLDPQTQVFAPIPERPIHRVALMSGGGGKAAHEAIAQGYDAFVTGEGEEWAQALALESGVAWIAAGHHATERGGVARLGDQLAGHFGLTHDFIDIPNPL